MYETVTGSVGLLGEHGHGAGAGAQSGRTKSTEQPTQG